MTVIYSSDGDPVEVIRGGISGEALADLLAELFGVELRCIRALDAP